MKGKYLGILLGCVVIGSAGVSVLALNNTKDNTQNVQTEAKVTNNKETSNTKVEVKTLDFAKLGIDEFNKTLFSNFSNQNINDYEISSKYNGDSFEYKNVYTTTFIQKNGKNFYAIEINKNTGKIYTVDCYVPSVMKNSKEVTVSSKEIQQELNSLSKEFLANLGISTENKEVESYYKSGHNREFVTVVYKDLDGNRKFVEFSYQEKQLVSYTSYDKEYCDSDNFKMNLQNKYVSF